VAQFSLLALPVLEASALARMSFSGQLYPNTWEPCWVGYLDLEEGAAKQKGMAMNFVPVEMKNTATHIII